LNIQAKQIIYKLEQKSVCDEKIPFYDNRQTDPNLVEYFYHFREYGIFHDEFEKGLIVDQQNQYCGYLSWKFRNKTNLKLKHFLSLIRKQKGFDVYFIDPFDEVTRKFDNVWLAGEYYHPGIISMTKEIFSKLSYNTNLLSKKYEKGNMGFCNYWIGNSFFWKKYIEFTRPVYQLIKREIEEKTNLGKELMKRADQEIDSNYIPFILERMFSTLLESDEQKLIKVWKISETEKRKLRHPLTRILLLREQFRIG